MKVKDIVGISAAMISGVFISLSLTITNIDKTEREAIFHLDRQVLVVNVPNDVILDLEGFNFIHFPIGEISTISSQLPF